jgi:hypothetical protein
LGGIKTKEKLLIERPVLSLCDIIRPALSYIRKLQKSDETNNQLKGGTTHYFLIQVDNSEQISKLRGIFAKLFSSST